MPELSQFKRRIALVGSSAHYGNAPVVDESIEIWTLGVLWKRLPRITRFYELHDFERKRSLDTTCVDWVRAKAEAIPIFLQTAHDDLPGVRVFPKDAIVERFGTYIRSSFDWILLHLYQEIEAEGGDYKSLYVTCHGIDMCADEEYGYQKPSFEGWLRYGQGQGMTLNMPPECDLFKSRGVYGWETNGQFAFRVRAKEEELEMRKAKEEAELESAKSRGYTASGALQAFKYLQQEMNGTAPDGLPERIAELEQVIALAKAECEARRDNVNQILGAERFLPWVKQYT